MQMSKTDSLWMKNFDPIEDIEMLWSIENACVVRTWRLIATLMFMQEHGWLLYELRPDDDPDWTEYNILKLYKPK